MINWFNVIICTVPLAPHTLVTIYHYSASLFIFLALDWKADVPKPISDLCHSLLNGESLNRLTYQGTKFEVAELEEISEPTLYIHEVYEVSHITCN